jgi:hypothetical protein
LLFVLKNNLFYSSHVFPHHHKQRIVMRNSKLFIMLTTLLIAATFFIGCNRNQPIGLIENNASRSASVYGVGGSWLPSSGSDQISGSSSTYGPGADVFNDNLYMFFKANTYNGIIYRYTSDPTGANWSNEIVSSATSTVEPAVAAFNNYLYVVYKGATNNNIYYIKLNSSGTWSGPVMLPSSITTTIAPALAVQTSYGGGPLLHLFYKGSNNSYIYHSYMDPSGYWTNPQQLSALTNMRPAAACWNLPNGYTCIVLAYKNGSAISIKMRQWGTWKTGTNVTGAATSQGPSITNNGANIFACAWQRSSDGQILYNLGSITTGDLVNYGPPQWEPTPHIIPGATTTPTAPCMVEFRNTTFFLHKGSTTNNLYKRMHYQP